MDRTGRILMVAVAAALAGVLATARWVRPDPRGYGTHEQLGLPPCGFRVLTGVPCPSCGMTTSFAYTVRGELSGALRANIAGCVLTLAVAGLIPWCLASAALARPVGLRSPERAAVVGVVAVIAVSLAGWLARFVWVSYST